MKIPKVMGSGEAQSVKREFHMLAKLKHTNVMRVLAWVSSWDGHWSGYPMPSAMATYGTGRRRLIKSPLHRGYQSWSGQHAASPTSTTLPSCTWICSLRTTSSTMVELGLRQFERRTWASP